MRVKNLTAKSWILVGLACAWLTGCTVTPDTAIKQPLSAKPAQIDKTTNNGGIFRPNRGLALFEDRRARFVGDILTVNLVEKTSATRKSETTESRSANADINIPVPVLNGNTPSWLGGTTWSPESSSEQSFKDNDTKSNNISGSITVTVVEVLENGNLLVAGEKRLAINNDTEFIRLSGIVNPMHVSANNVVDSTRLADVTIESKNSQGLDAAQVASIFARFFLTLVPF
jgi:flagellar L-ring protein precursor FlgH